MLTRQPRDLITAGGKREASALDCRRAATRAHRVTTSAPSQRDPGSPAASPLLAQLRHGTTFARPHSSSSPPASLSLPTTPPDSMRARASTPKRPWGLRWRSSVWFITAGALAHSGSRSLRGAHTAPCAVVGIGIATDLLVYSLIIPVLPFRLEELGYKNPSALVGYLLFAFVRARAHSPNLIFTPPCV
jgi:hypothetical protein